MPIIPPILHAALIMAGWAVSVAGVIFAMVSKGKSKLKVHMSLELVGGLAMIVGAILGMFLTIIHAFIATAAIALLAMGIGGGMYYKSVKVASGDSAAIEKKKAFRMMHITGGRITNITLLVVIALGFLSIANVLVP